MQSLWLVVSIALDLLLPSTNTKVDFRRRPRLRLACFRPRAPSVPEGWVAVIQDSIGGYTAGEQLELDGSETGIGLEGV